MKKILLAEDEDFLATLLKSRLMREGFDVTLVKNGMEILPTLKSDKPDLLLLDIILPDKVGFEVLDDMEKAKIKVPFMVMSNLGQDEDIERAKRYGAIEYFVKAHINIDDLVKNINTFFAQGK